jgi:hypothetical protein
MLNVRSEKKQQQNILIVFKENKLKKVTRINKRNMAIYKRK